MQKRRPRFHEDFAFYGRADYYRIAQPSGRRKDRRAPHSASAQVSRELGISQATFFKWKQRFGGMTVSEAKRLRALEAENARLKRLLAERSLEVDALQDVLKKF
jgi:putative transposase